MLLCLWEFWTLTVIDLKDCFFYTVPLCGHNAPLICIFCAFHHLKCPQSWICKSSWVQLIGYALYWVLQLNNSTSFSSY